MTLTTSGNVPLNGSLSITLRLGSCDGTVVYTQAPIAVTNDASGSTYDTTNSTFKVTVANNAQYWWRAEFTSSDPLLAGVTECERTDITIDNNPG